MRSLAGLCMNNEARRRKGSCGVDLISDALPFGRLWYGHASRKSLSFDPRGIQPPREYRLASLSHPERRDWRRDDRNSLDDRSPCPTSCQGSGGEAFRCLR
jgi:hypothetical protein